MARGKKRKKKQGPVRKWLWRLVKTGFVAGLLATIALVVAVLVIRSSLPGFEDLKSSPNGQMIRVLDVNGKELFSMGPSYGEWLQFDDIPEVMKAAMIAVEDRRYENHPGVDPIGIARSVQVRMQRGYWAQGGSTITQQLARNVFLNNNRTFG
ncbi:MAG: biosynthetic peptidoglycan transglycosylase, partial [Marinomonas sp.]